MGAIMFSSAKWQQQKVRFNVTKELKKYLRLVRAGIYGSPTDEDEGKADEEGQDITAERLVILPITLCKNAQAGVDIVLTQSLEQ